MGIKGVERPKLGSMDDLLGVGGMDRDDKPISNMPITLNLEKLKPFAEHPFRLYTGERLEDMVESIRQHGVLSPILVRPSGAGYEILSGHNRVNAARLAGLQEVPAVVMENLSDEEAMVCVIETNLMQRSFADMLHSEKAAVIAAHRSKLFSQGKRNDILQALRQIEGGDTSAQFEQRLDTRGALAQEYGLDRNTIARYLRIAKLIPELQSCVDTGRIGFIAGVELSFLAPEEQELLHENLSGSKVDGKKATLLRKKAEQEKLTEESVRVILAGTEGEKAARGPTIRISEAAYSRFFYQGQTAREIRDIVEKALEMYFFGE